NYNNRRFHSSNGNGGRGYNNNNNNSYRGNGYTGNRNQSNYNQNHNNNGNWRDSNRPNANASNNSNNNNSNNTSRHAAVRSVRTDDSRNACNNNVQNVNIDENGAHVTSWPFADMEHEETQVKVHKLQVEDEHIINKIPTEILRSNIPDYFEQDQVKCLNRGQLIQEHLSMRGHKESSLKLKKPEERNSFPLLEKKYIKRHHDVKKQSANGEEQPESSTSELKA